MPTVNMLTINYELPAVINRAKYVCIGIISYNKTSQWCDLQFATKTEHWLTKYAPYIDFTHISLLEKHIRAMIDAGRFPGQGKRNKLTPYDDKWWDRAGKSFGKSFWFERFAEYTSAPNKNTMKYSYSNQVGAILDENKEQIDEYDDGEGDNNWNDDYLDDGDYWYDGGI